MMLVIANHRKSWVNEKSQSDAKRTRTQHADESDRRQSFGVS